MKKRFTEQHIAFAPRQVEPGTAVAEIASKLEGSVQTLCRWKRKYSGVKAGTVVTPLFLAVVLASLSKLFLTHT